MELDYEEEIPFRNDDHSDQGRRPYSDEEEAEIEFNPKKLK